MKILFRFNLKYFILSMLLLITEIMIALYAHDDIIRPYFGDYLVVILMYCFMKSFCSLSVLKTSIFVLILSYLIETMQYFNWVHLLHLDDSTLARILVGNYFAWMDLLMYTLRVLTVLLLEKLIQKKKTVSFS
ncbi:MAG: DUF2809 domain-containing protein [Sphingobacteriales bacterium]|nr:DUF2809 domain-containing protein [Sphingobacteriales bacterium]